MTNAIKSDTRYIKLETAGANRLRKYASKRTDN